MLRWGSHNWHCWRVWKLKESACFVGLVWISSRYVFLCKGIGDIARSSLEIPWIFGGGFSISSLAEIDWFHPPSFFKKKNSLNSFLMGCTPDREWRMDYSSCCVYIKKKKKWYEIEFKFWNFVNVFFIWIFWAAIILINPKLSLVIVTSVFHFPLFPQPLFFLFFLFSFLLSNWNTFQLDVSTVPTNDCTHKVKAFILNSIRPVICGLALLSNLGLSVIRLA